jgi:hypothetical protein
MLLSYRVKLKETILPVHTIDSQMLYLSLQSINVNGALRNGETARSKKGR